METIGHYGKDALNELRIDIRELRRDRKLNQEAFGKVVGLSQSALSAFEQGRNTPRGKALTELFRVRDEWKAQQIAPEKSAIARERRAGAPDDPPIVAHVLEKLSQIGEWLRDEKPPEARLWLAQCQFENLARKIEAYLEKKPGRNAAAQTAGRPDRRRT
jgi:transcriptional regulator with XRE-family HTH domain